MTNVSTFFSDVNSVWATLFKIELKIELILVCQNAEADRRDRPPGQLNTGMESEESWKLSLVQKLS